MKVTIKCGCGNEIKIDATGEINSDDYEVDLLKVHVGKYETLIKCSCCGDGLKIV